jgi:hypothetical protein
LLKLPDEVAGLSVLFTVLYIWKRSSNKRMTKKAKLQTCTLLYVAFACIEGVERG